MAKKPGPLKSVKMAHTFHILFISSAIVLGMICLKILKFLILLIECALKQFALFHLPRLDPTDPCIS